MMSLYLFSLRSVSPAGIFLFLTTLFCAFFLSTPPAHAAPCAKYTSGSAVPAGYGASYDLWNLTNGSLLNTDCTTSAFSIQVGNGDTTTANFAVYKTGYRWTGSAWQAITFVPDGGESSGNYIMGKAKNEGTLSYAGTDSYFVAFTCSLRAGAWKCGCRDTGCGRGYWQLQAAVKSGGNASEADKNASPANKIFGLPLIYSFDSYWSSLVAKGDTNPSTYFDVGHNDRRNKCVAAGCTRTLTTFAGRPAMKFTTYAGYNYSAGGTNSSSVGGSTDGQVSMLAGNFARKAGKSYGELMEAVDVYIPSTANWHLPSEKLNAQATTDEWARCKVTGKGIIGIQAGQVNPLPAPEPENDGWNYVSTASGLNGGKNISAGAQKATFAIVGPGIYAYGNRDCSGFLNQWKANGAGDNGFGFWDIDENAYLEGMICEEGTSMILPRDRWFTIEVYGKLDTNGSNGIFKHYIDGKLVCGHSHMGWGGSRGWRFVGFGGVFMFGGAGDYYVVRDTTSIYYSNVRVFGR